MFKLLIVAISYLVANSNGLNENEDSIIYDPTAPKPCSNNATSAYVDILLVIDTSSNMGNANLRKIGTTLSLILPKFTIGQQSDITQGYRNTRVGVITYDSNVNIIANYTASNSVLDVSKILNGLTASNDHAVNIEE
uniref:VWFA domain-containing protein n=1 Tax=Acrobeloides nanus TaxID=290746 RepID=A0A914CYV1_9BILA